MRGALDATEPMAKQAANVSASTPTAGKATPESAALGNSVCPAEALRRNSGKPPAAALALRLTLEDRLDEILSSGRLRQRSDEGQSRAEVFGGWLPQSNLEESEALTFEQLEQWFDDDDLEEGGLVDSVMDFLNSEGMSSGVATWRFQVDDCLWRVGVGVVVASTAGGDEAMNFVVGWQQVVVWT